ncbi:ParB/RepB/Spo0J family partition protein [Paraburkholderia dioscoreae]|uniref:Nuclease n=1 Tax=Paraburkholderia dioscoreae TaxID=2604047 RepID=A0A5Q4ZI70_9BURK|nr:ParB/RepB/Spo0J family partition protein [Paraburkholderia dioscoreae]VVD31046.1 Nuclease [Paraburkholderia dioscoreae]
MVTKPRGLQISKLSELAKMTAGPATAAAIEEATGAITTVILIVDIRIKPQDRLDFADIAVFADRLTVVGHVHTAILVRAIEGGGYELIAGERRVRGSTLNGWPSIPAKVFPAQTPDYVIRLYQVSENFDRKPLSAKETALGLAGDIERFGRDEAAKLWTSPNGKQRSESWISKHLRFRKYGPITRGLFDAGLFDDIEAANKMDDIEEQSAEVAGELADRMKAGEKIGRVALDARLVLIKEAGQGARANVILSPSASAPVASSTSGTTAERETDDSAEREHQSAASNDESGSKVPEPVAAATVVQAVQQAVEEQPAARPAGAASKPRFERAGGGDPLKSVIWRMEEMFQTSTGSIQRFRQLQADLAAAGVSKEDADWRLWVAFAQMACSALVGVGPQRADQMLIRLTQELNSKGPLELLNALHPSRKAGVLPDDFRYDTEREIHPLAPNNWAL